MASSSKQHFQTFTVGKLDAGMILIGDRAHLIEFPSLLLPPGTTSGSIVSISVHRNVAAEQAHARSFANLQSLILNTYGSQSPQPPVLALRNTTQTSVTLEWGKLELANAKLRGVEIYRNGTRLAGIPNPTHNTSTKLSSLSLDTDYTFQLVMKTTAGTYPSNVIRVRTHTINDTSGISVCFGTVQDPHHLHQAKIALDQMGAKYSDKIQIDTTHFVCTTPAGPAGGSGPSVEYQKALQLTLPVVEPGWVLACLHEKKMVPISQHMLGSSPAFNPLPSASFNRPSEGSLPPSPHTTAEDVHVFPQQVSDNGPVGGSSEHGSTDAISPETRARMEEEEERERNRPRTPGGGVLNRGFKFPLASEGGPSTPPHGSDSNPTTPPQAAEPSSSTPAATAEPASEIDHAPSASIASVQSPIDVSISPPTPPPAEASLPEPPTIIEPTPEPEPEVEIVVPTIVASDPPQEDAVPATTEDLDSAPPPPPEINIVAEDVEPAFGATEEVVVMESAPPVSEDGEKVQEGDHEEAPVVAAEAPATPPVEEVELMKELALEDKKVTNIEKPEPIAVAPSPDGDDDEDDAAEGEEDKAETNGVAAGGASASSKSKKKNDKKKQKKKAAAAGKVENEEVDLNA